MKPNRVLVLTFGEIGLRENILYTSELKNYVRRP